MPCRSAIRATTVLRHLSEADGLAEDRMSAAGYGSTRPLVPDSDPNYVTANRRVDIVVASIASADANALLPGLEAAAEKDAAAPAAEASTPASTTDDAGQSTTDSEGGHG